MNRRRRTVRPLLAVETLESRDLLSSTPLLTAPRVFPASEPGSIHNPAVVGDFTGDGHLDFLNLGYTLNVLPGRGDGTFGEPLHTVVGYTVNRLIAGDFNEDGKLDFISDGGQGEFSARLFQGRGDGTFQSPRNLRAGVNLQNFVTADVNNDAHLDLVAVNGELYDVGAGGSITILLGRGDGTFQPPIVHASVLDVVEHVAVGDLNGDGRPDLVVTGNWPRDSGVGVLLGNGDGTFQAEYLLELNKTAVSAIPVLADFNRDGRLDLALAAPDYDDFTNVRYLVRVLPGQGNGHFTEPQGGHAMPFLAALNGFVAGDFDGDGATDLAAFGDGWDIDLAILRNRGDGTFEMTPGFTLGGTYHPSAVDLNGDQRTDLVFTDYSSSAIVLLGQSDGEFALPTHFPVMTAEEGSLFGAYALDVTGDGRADLLTQIYGPWGLQTVLRIFPAQADDTFGAPVDSSLGGGYFNSLVVADFNGDGFLDLAANYPGDSGVVGPGGDSHYAGGKIYVLFGRGDGRFPEIEIIDAESPMNLAVADFNHDGRPDLVTANFNEDAVTVYLGLGNGLFEEPVDYPIGRYRTTNVVAVDLDGDQIVDLAATFRGVAWDGTPVTNGGVAVFRGRGDGTFDPPMYLLNSSDNGLAPSEVIRPWQLAVGDINGDGRPDLAIDSLHYLLNRGDGTFTANVVPYAPLGGYPTSLALIDFDGNGTIDLLTHGLSLGIALGAGNGTFAPPVLFAARAGGYAGQSLTVADLTGDGKPDVLGQGNWKNVAIYTNTSTPAPLLSSLQFEQSALNVPEGGSVVLTVLRSGSTADTVSVAYSTTNGTATAGVDYTALNGTLTFNPGETSKTVTLVSLADSLVEGDETVLVTLSNPSSGAILGVSTVEVTIRDVVVGNPGRLQFSVAALSVAENVGNATLLVTRTDGNAGSVSVGYSTMSGSATPGLDYQTVQGTLIWADGDFSFRTITVPILNDTLVEGEETFTVVLANPTGGATLGNPSSAIVTILDEDSTEPGTEPPPPPTPTVSVLPVVVAPSPPQPTSVQQVVRRRGKTQRSMVLVSFAGGPMREIMTPFQGPTFRAVQAILFDLDGDGRSDSVRFTARKGTKLVSRFVPL